MKKQNYLLLLCFLLLGYLIPCQANTYCQPSGSTHSSGNSYVKSITSEGGTSNLNYQVEAMPASLLNYVGEASVKQGTNLTFHLIANNLGSYNTSTVRQDLRYNVAIYFVDWDQDGQFSTTEYAPLCGKTSGEGLHNVGGNATGDNNVLDITHSITIPEDAALGKYRVRVVYTNAWVERGQLSGMACSGIKEGIVYDFDINVQSSVPSYSITITEPLNGTLILKDADQQEVLTGSEIQEGTQLTIEATPSAGYETEFVKINGNAVYSSTFIVEEASVISATFTKKSVIGEYPEATFSKTGFVGKINSAKTTGGITNLNYTDADATRTYPNSVVGRFTVEAGSQFTLTAFIKYARWGNIHVCADMAGNGLEFVKYYDSKRDGTPYDAGKEESIDFTVPADLTPGTYRIRLFITNVDSENEAKTVGPGGNYSEGGYYDFEYEVLPSYVINIPVAEGGVIEVKNGEQVVNSGDAVLKGTELLITATPNEGYKLVNLFLNNEKLIESSFQVAKASTITAFFTNSYMVTYSSNEGGTVTAYANDRIIETNQPLAIEESLKFVFTLEDNIEIESALLNGIDVKDQIVNNEYVVGIPTEDQVLVVTFSEIIPTHLASITIHGSDYGTCLTEMETAEGWVAVTDGMRIKEGTTLKMTINLVDENCELVSLMMNGADMKDYLENNMLVGVVPAEGIELIVTFRNTATPTALYLPSNTGVYKYMFRFDDALLGAHQDRNNTDPTTGHDQGDYRSRNITMSAWVNPQSTTGDLFGYVQKDFYASLGAFKILLNNGNLECDFRYWTGGGNAPGTKNKIVTNEAITTDEWAFVTVTIDDANHKIALYKNGEKLGESTLDQYGIGYLMDKSVFFVGNSGMQTNVDNVQVWNRVLTEKEILGSMAGYATAPTGLIYNYLFGDENYDKGNKTFANKGCPTVVPAATPGEATNIAPGVVVAGSSSNWASAASTNATFGVGHKLPSYTITSIPAENGSFILKNGADEIASGTKLQKGALITVVAVPNEGVRVGEILVNGIAITDNSFNLIEDASVEVKFSSYCVLNYSVVGAGEVIARIGEEIVPNGHKFEKNTLIDFEVIPQEGHELVSFVLNDTDNKLDMTDNHYQLEASSDIEVIATFAKIKHTITIPTVEHGTINVFNGTTPVTDGEKVDEGSVLTITLTPEEGASVSEFTVNGIDKLEELVNNRITLTVKDNVVLDATFKITLFTLSVINDIPDFGTLEVIDGATGLPYVHGDKLKKGTNLTIFMTPAERCNLQNFYDNGMEVKDIDSYYDPETNKYEYWPAAVNSDVSFKAIFAMAIGLDKTKMDGVYYDAELNKLVMPLGAKATVFAVTGEPILELTHSAELAGLKKGCYIAKVATSENYVILKFVRK